MACNLNVALRPVVVDVLRPMSKMDFRSNEAGPDRFLGIASVELGRSRFPHGHIPFR
jgi:hypothetical protein